VQAKPGAQTKSAAVKRAIARLRFHRGPELLKFDLIEGIKRFPIAVNHYCATPSKNPKRNCIDFVGSLIETDVSAHNN